MSEQAPSGFKQMSQTATELAANAPTAEELNRRTAQTLHIRELANSSEVHSLNETAQIAVYGTNGETSGYVHPVTGKPLTKPVKGRINDILEVPNPGKTPNERRDYAARQEAKAKDYKTTYEELLGQDFEPCQAKLIMDRRESWISNNERFDKLLGVRSEKQMDMIIKQNLKNGDSHIEALEKAEKRVAVRQKSPLKVREKKQSFAPGKTTVEIREKQIEKIDIGTELSKLKNLIRTNGIFTKDQLDQAEGDEAKTRELGIVRPEGVREELDRLALERNKLRADYARRLAGRSSRTFRFGKNKEFGKKAVAQAKEQYENSRNALLRLEITLLYNSGIDPKSVDKLVDQAAEVGALVDEYRLANEIRNQELLASGSYREQTTADGDLVYDREGIVQIERVEQPRNAVGRGVAAFKDFWNRNSGGKFFSKATLKRTAAVAGVGAAVGAPSALAGSVILGPAIGAAGGGYVASRITRSLLGVHLDKHARVAMADRRWNDIYYDRLGAAMAGGRGRPGGFYESLADFAEKRANRDVRKNRTRVGLAAASLAISAAGGEVITHALGATGGHEPNGIHGSATTPAGYRLPEIPPELIDKLSGKK